MVASNKDRIYVALYARGGRDVDTYHWAIIVGPKTEAEGRRGTRYHVRHRLDPNKPGQQRWEYEALEIPLTQTSMLLARIMIGKVTDGPRLARALQQVPLVQGDPNWTCRIWVRDAIAALKNDGKSLGTSVTDWPKTQASANAYVAKKRQQRRYDGSGNWKPGTVPTYDLLTEQEVVE